MLSSFCKMRSEMYLLVWCERLLSVLSADITSSHYLVWCLISALSTMHSRLEHDLRRRFLQVLRRVTACQSADAMLSLDALLEHYSELQLDFREEYIMYNLPAAALSQVSILLRS